MRAFIRVALGLCKDVSVQTKSPTKPQAYRTRYPSLRGYFFTFFGLSSTSLFVFPLHVAVETNNFTVRYFILYGFDRPTSTDHFRYTKFLLPSNMVKCQGQYIGVSTITAWMIKKVVINILFDSFHRPTSPFVV